MIDQYESFEQFVDLYDFAPIIKKKIKKKIKNKQKKQPVEKKPRMIRTREYIKCQKHLWYLKNMDREKRKRKEYYHLHKERCNKYSKEYYLSHKDYYKEYVKRYHRRKN